MLETNTTTRPGKIPRRTIQMTFPANCGLRKTAAWSAESRLSAIYDYRRKSAPIVSIASVNAFYSWGDFRAYAAAKAGLIGLTRTLAVNHGRAGIRANVICPGTINTDVWKPFREREPGFAKRIESKYPLGRIGARARGSCPAPPRRDRFPPGRSRARV